jgi:hypothetical protein
MKIKHCLVICLVLLCAVFVAPKISNAADAAIATTLTVAYQKITLTPWTAGSKCIPVAMWTDSGIAFWISPVAAGTGAKFIPADSTYSNDCFMPDADGSLGWFKSASVTPILYIDIGRAK